MNMTKKADTRHSGRTLATTTTMYRHENGRTYHAYRETLSSLRYRWTDADVAQETASTGNRTMRSRTITKPLCTHAIKAPSNGAPNLISF